ncbi:unnamed protein product [Peniophora sp. CBMAI 1063]|nr:unnamed protein product [Peniophora sp. CBMAI 1063]
METKLKSAIVELNVTNKIKDDLLNKIPATLAASCSHENECIRHVLGFGHERWPKGIPRDEWDKLYGSMRWYTEEQYKSGVPAGSKTHHPDHNMHGQSFMEDELGEIVSNELAKIIREYVKALLNCLRMFGQATETFDGLDAMSRGFLYVNLLTRWPFLGLCDNGTWKLDALIFAVYRNWAEKHGLTKAAKEKAAKAASQAVKKEEEARSKEAAKLLEVALATLNLDKAQYHIEKRESMTPAPTPVSEQEQGTKTSQVAPMPLPAAPGAVVPTAPPSSFVDGHPDTATIFAPADSIPKPVAVDPSLLAALAPIATSVAHSAAHLAEGVANGEQMHDLVEQAGAPENVAGAFVQQKTDTPTIAPPQPAHTAPTNPLPETVPHARATDATQHPAPVALPGCTTSSPATQASTLPVNRGRVRPAPGDPEERPPKKFKGPLLKDDTTQSQAKSERGEYLRSLQQDPKLRDTLTKAEALERWKTVQADPAQLEPWKKALAVSRAKAKAEKSKGTG